MGDELHKTRIPKLKLQRNPVVVARNLGQRNVGTVVGKVLVRTDIAMDPSRAKHLNEHFQPCETNFIRFADNRTLEKLYDLGVVPKPASRTNCRGV